MSVKAWLICVMSVFAAGGLVAEPQSSLISTTFSRELHKDLPKALLEEFSSRFYELHPDIPTSDRQISVVNPIVFEKMPKEAVKAVYDIAAIQSILGRTIVKVTLQTEKDQELEVRQVIFHVEAKRSTVRAARRLLRGQKIATEDVVVRKEPLYGQPHGAVRDLHDLVGREAAFTISPGALFIYSMVTTPALIKPRQTVEVIIQKKAITLKVAGIAQQEGRRGDEIRVKLSTGQQNVIRGEVIDDKTVLMLGRY